MLKSGLTSSSPEYIDAVAQREYFFGLGGIPGAMDKVCMSSNFSLLKLIEYEVQLRCSYHANL